MLPRFRRNMSTPLIMACRNGRLNEALHLITQCRVDIEQVGRVIFENGLIEGATPLWCAAAAGHLDLVKALISFNASVNRTTKSNSTPLRAACYNGNLPIVKYLIEHGADVEIANSRGHTCLMIGCNKGHFGVCKYLLECGAEVNRKSNVGSTALHDSAEFGSLPLIEILLEYGASFYEDLQGITPLLTAAVEGHAPIVEYFIVNFNLSKQDKINALELLGATYVDRENDTATALNCWRRAMQLRYEDVNFPLVKPSSNPIAAYCNAMEVNTPQQLENLIADPEEMKVQSLFIRERIIGQGHRTTLYYIRIRAIAYAQHENFDRSIQLLRYALEVQHKILKPLSPVTGRVLLLLAEVFSSMMAEVLAGMRNLEDIPFLDILDVFQRSVKEIEVAMQISPEENFNLSALQRTLKIQMHLLGLLCRFQPVLSEAEDLELKRSVYHLVRLNLRTKEGWTPLHLACCDETSSISHFGSMPFQVSHQVFPTPSAEVVELLLDVGASPNATDLDKNTPLHVAAMNDPFPQDVFNVLLSHGAHLDMCNSENMTPLQLAQNSSILALSPLKYINLQCLSAQAIRKFKLPYKKLVPEHLEEFIESH